MRRRFFFPACVAAFSAIATAALIVPAAGAGDVAVQYVQVSSHAAMTVNGQPITNARQARSIMTQQMGKMALVGVGQSLISTALHTVLSSVNPVLSMVANLIANKLQQKAMQSAMQAASPKLGVTEVEEPPVTTTVAAARRRIDYGNVTLLVECDLNRLVTINNADHTYSVKTFDELAAEGAVAQAQQAGNGSAHSDACKTPRATIAHNPDDQTDIIAGMTARHKFDTTTYTFPDGCNAKLKEMTQTQDTWYAATDIPNHCALPVAGNVSDQNAPASVEIPLRIVRKFELPSTMPTIPPEMANNPQMAQAASIVSHLSDFMTFATETQSVKQIPYDPASFDIPAGYAQTENAATPPPAVRQQM